MTEDELERNAEALRAFSRATGTDTARRHPVEALTVVRVARHRHRAMVVVHWLAAPAATASLTAAVLTLLNALGGS